jgi:pimeloyl-ACP methyl ester carboxylesterase
MNTKMMVHHLGKKLDVSTFYLDQGKDVVLFLHGLGCSKDSFIDIFKFGHLENYSILIPDLIGFGDSSKPTDFSYSMEAHAQICQEILKKIDAQKVHIVAHSMSGVIGLLLAEKMPHKISSFINIEGNLIKSDCGLLSRKTMKVSYQDFKDKVFDEIKEGVAKLKEPGSELWLHWSAKSDSKAFYLSLKSLVDWSHKGILLDMFHQLPTNKKYFYGDKNSKRAVLNLLNGIEKVQISNSGHSSMIDNPQEFYAKLNKVITNPHN